MGIRLYPNCDTATRERLAGVPAGTWDRLQAFEAKCPKVDGPTMTAWYDRLFKNSDLNTMHHFETFGWGRLTTEAIKFITKVQEFDYAGEITDPALAQGLIHAMGITAEGVTSVRWS